MGADATDIDVDPMLAALYSEPEDLGAVKDGRVSLVMSGGRLLIEKGDLAAIRPDPIEYMRPLHPTRRIAPMKPIAFYSTCSACGGHGRLPGRPDGPRTEICPECRGAGFVPTKDGRAIIGLVRAAGLEGLLPEA